MDGYQALVDAAMKSKPGDQPSLSDWELEEWEPGAETKIGAVPNSP
jgi:hypothetical protein